jgi:hypothetical protein
MDMELPITWISQGDDITPQADGTMLRERKYVFRLGKFGAFTERVPLANFDETEIGRRVEKLRTHLRATQAL